MTQAEDPRRAYIAIAAQKFAAAGYHGTSLAAVASAAGVTKQALLHFFGTKERLYADVLTALADRLGQAVEDARQDDPAAHLLAYFLAFRRAALERPDDIRLVVRALLDSDEKARKWPLRPYLDQVEELLRATPAENWSKAQRMAWVSQMIGLLQYLAISAPTITGMYGAEMAEEMAQQYDAAIRDAVARLHQPV